MPEYSALDRLQRALNPLPAAAVDGPHQMSVTGTVNIIGGGSGGTSMTDDQAFTPGSTAITPAGGYYGGRTIGSGHAAAPALSNSAVMLVHVVAGGAGGGLAQLQVVGSDNSNFLNVGFPSGGTFRNTVPVFGQGGSFPVVGSVNVVQGTLPLPVMGSVNAVSNLMVQGTNNTAIHVGFASGAGGLADGGAAVPITGSANVVIGGGTAGVTQTSVPWLITGSVGVTPLATETVWYGGGFVDTANSAIRVSSVGTVPVPITTASFMYADSTNSAIRVNVVTGGAGGGVANITVRGSANTDLHVGYASGAGFNVDGGAYLPILGTVNTVGGGAGFASVAVYGSPANPVYNVGSVNVVNAVGILGSVSVTGSVNITGSINPVGIFGSVSVVGSVNITGSINPVGVFGSVNTLASLAGVTANGSLALDVDPRANLTLTQWIISGAASGQFNVSPSAPASQRIWWSSYQLIATGTIDLQFMSPSGVAITGSFRLLPGAGFALAGAAPNGPVLVGSQQSGIYILSAGTQNIGGVAVGWVGT